MSERKPRLSARQEAATYSLCFLVFLSGLLWWWAQHYLRVAGEFSMAPHWSESWSQKIHGFAAMLFLGMFGYLIPVHMGPALRLKRSRRSGILVAALCIFLAGTGWGIYYFGDEIARARAIALHVWVGFIFPLLLAVHLAIGKSTRRAT